MCVVLLLPLYSQDTFVIHDERSRFNDETPPREKTIGIINHDTQGDWPGCRTWLQCINYGPPMTNYLINRTGRIELICDDWRAANHAGDSYYEGDTSLSRFFIGIEYVGYFDEPLTDMQIKAGRWLNDSLKRKYPDIIDKNIISHASAACWYPNDPKNPHPGFYTRGRRSDGIRFIDPVLMEKFGLTERNMYDIDQVLSDSVYASPAHQKRCFGRSFTKEELLAIRKSLLEKVDTTLALLYISPQEVCEIEVCYTEPGLKPISIDKYIHHTAPLVAVLPKRRLFKRF